MEWWKLFSGTFFLIFLAELGDKTQLAAMAKTADSPDNSMAKWVVFFAASLALVASTFIAVFLGHLLKTVVPDERYIRLAAGALFLVFGGMILYETYRSFRPGPMATATVGSSEVQPGLVGGLALRAAMDFEAFAGARYRRLASCSSARLSALLLDLAQEEDGHLARLRGLPDVAVCDAAPPCPETGTGDPAGESGTLSDLIRHEQATADFYQALAERATIPSVKSVFARLAQEEQSHARRLAAMGGSRPDPV